MCDEELRQRAKLRTEVRLRHPGICAFYFDVVLDIVLEEVLGWDVAKDKPRVNFDSMLEDVIAFIVSVEEQGRRTLHAHIQVWVKDMSKMQVWVKDMSKMREKLHSNSRAEVRSVARSIARAVDKVEQSHGHKMHRFGSLENSIYANTTPSQTRQECLIHGE